MGLERQRMAADRTGADKPPRLEPSEVPRVGNGIKRIERRGQGPRRMKNLPA